jgi:hypothetical protein
MSDVAVQNNEIIAQNSLITVLDQDGDMATALITSSQYAAPNSGYPGDPDFGSAYGPDVLMNYAIALSTLLFFEDALVGFGELSSIQLAFTDGAGGTWVEPGSSQLA